MVNVSGDEVGTLAPLGDQPGAGNGNVKLTLPDGSVRYARSAEVTVTPNGVRFRSVDGAGGFVHVSGLDDLCEGQWS